MTFVDGIGPRPGSEHRSKILRSFYGLAAWVYLVLGAALAMQGPALPQIRSTFGLGIGEVSWLFPAMALGYLLGVVGSSLSSTSHRCWLVTVLGIMALVAGFAAMGVARDWGYALVAGFVLGLGFGCVDVTLNAAIGDVIQQEVGKTRALNVLHTFFAAGTLIGPLLWAWQLGQGSTWRQAHGLVAVLLIPALVAALWMRLPAASQLDAGQEHGWLRLLADVRLRWLAILTLLYVGVEAGISAWLATYMIEIHSVGPATGARASAAFWAALLVGRLITAFLIGRWTIRQVLLTSMAVVILALIGAIRTESSLLAIVLFAVSGFTVSGIFATILALAQARHPQDNTRATALMMGSAAIGWLVFPWLIGLAGELWTVSATMIGAVLIAGVMLATAVFALPSSSESGSPAAAR